MAWGGRFIDGLEGIYRVAVTTVNWITDQAFSEGTVLRLFLQPWLQLSIA